MKKYWKLLLCAAIGMGTFTACEDVPAPYNIPTEGQGGENTTPSADYIFNQSFSTSLGSFNSQSESGELEWKANSRYGAIISGYDDFDGTGSKYNKPGVTYLVSPAIDLTEVDSAYVVIEQAINYAKSTIAEDNILLIRTGDSTWEELPMDYEGLGNSFTYIRQNIQIPNVYIGKTIQLALKHTAHNDYSSTWEVKGIRVVKGQAPKKADSGTPGIEGVGSGTKDDPYDVPTTIKLIAAGPPSTPVYTKGIVSKVDEISAQYGNATYYISNDGTTTDQLEVYRGLGLGGEKFKEGGIKVGDEVIVYGKIENYGGRTPEFTQGSELYMLNGEIADNGPGNSGDAKGTGTLEDPLNSVAANNIASALANGAQSNQAYYIKGKVSSVREAFGTQYGNASFYISDDGSKNGQFYVFRCLYLGNKKWQNGDAQIKEGDEVIVYAKLTNYQGNTPETVQGETYLYSLNGKTDGTTPGPQGEEGEAKGTGTLEDPFNSVKANEVASALASGAESTEDYYIKGKIVSIKEAYGVQYGNGSFYISDDGTAAGQFLVYHALYLGNKKWVNGQTQPKAGDEVIVYGKLTNYKGNTPETVQNKAYLYSLNGQTEAGETPDTPDPQPGDSDAKTLDDFTNGDFEAWDSDSQPTGWKSASTASNATLAKSSDAHGGSFAVCVKGLTSANKRLGYQEMELEAGTYNCSFWTKAATDSPASLCPGYAAIGTGNPVYKYDQGDDGKNRYVNNIGSEWQQVKYSFTLTEKTTVCLIVMNSKTTGTDLLIDDFTITKN